MVLRTGSRLRFCMPAFHWPPILSHWASPQNVGRAFRQANKIRRLPPCSSDHKLPHCQTLITFQDCSDRGFRDKAERTIKTLRTSVCVSLSERPSGCVWRTEWGVPPIVKDKLTRPSRSDRVRQFYPGNRQNEFYVLICEYIKVRVVCKKKEN